MGSLGDGRRRVTLPAREDVGVYDEERSAKDMRTREMVMRRLKVSTVLGALLLWGVLLALTSNPAHAVSSSSCSATDGTTTCGCPPV
jgi:hypothetical protein